MLAVVKPSPLRLWGFLLTVLGGALITFGSIGDWAAVTLGGSSLNAIPTKGIDLWQGKVVSALGLVIVVAILVLRSVAPERRSAISIAIAIMALVALALALWCLLAVETVVRDAGVDALVKTVVAQLGITAQEARGLVLQVMDSAGIDVQVQSGLWISIGGAVLALAGGLVDLAWVRQKALAGDAIDPDTVSERPGEAPLQA